jgi:hypothetical protein
MKENICLIILILVFLFSSLYSDEPEWYRRLSRQEYEIIGYGSSNNIEEARTIAKKEIANSIQTQIYYESTFELSEINSVVNEKANLYLKAKTDVVLNDLKTMREELKKKIWYVALCYDNLPIEKKFANRVIVSEFKSENQNRYLQNSPLIRSVNEELNCMLDIQLKRKNRIWYLAYENILLPLSPDEFEKLFIRYNSENISITQSSSVILTEGNIFSFSIKSLMDGYFSIVNVYEDGECFIITSNQPIQKNNPICFPESSSNIELVAGLFTDKQATYDLYIVLFDINEINLSRLQTASSKIVKDEWHFKFNEVIEMMDIYEFGTVLLRIRPK